MDVTGAEKDLETAGKLSGDAELRSTYLAALHEADGLASTTEHLRDLVPGCETETLLGIVQGFAAILREPASWSAALPKIGEAVKAACLEDLERLVDEAGGKN